MSNTNLLENIPAEEWQATPPAMQTLFQKLSLIAAEVTELRERVARLENNAPPVPVANDPIMAPEAHPYAKVIGALSGEIWDEIFDEMECEHQREIAAEEAAK